MLCEKWIRRITLLAAVSIAGCASLRGESDQLDEFGSDSRDRTGILGVSSDVALKSAKSAIGLGPDQSLSKGTLQSGGTTVPRSKPVGSRSARQTFPGGCLDFLQSGQTVA